jgi:hypothetical protein
MLRTLFIVIALVTAPLVVAEETHLPNPIVSVKTTRVHSPCVYSGTKRPSR